jgi:hypothetical protein
VYNAGDRRAYPMSSYSYMIVPTTTAAPFTADKGATLGRFILYFVCAGQQKAEQLGYAPLPPNLVQAAFASEQKIPGAPTPPALNACHNPTIDGTYAPPEPVTVAPRAATGGNAAAAFRAAAGLGTGAASTGTGTGSTAATGTDPLTGADGTQDPSGQIVSNLASVSLPHGGPPVSVLFATVAALAATLAIFGPAAVSVWRRRRRTAT